MTWRRENMGRWLANDVTKSGTANLQMMFGPSGTADCIKSFYNCEYLQSCEWSCYHWLSFCANLSFLVALLLPIIALVANTGRLARVLGLSALILLLERSTRWSRMEDIHVPLYRSPCLRRMIHSRTRLQHCAVTRVTIAPEAAQKRSIRHMDNFENITNLVRPIE
ncbi:uncharacterized protein EDB91DRAFT_124382 [Suillus paluster]|uniref:uncharacterized protein n=1 Tax=Suillus paluster TaxID=48578 RepID=UPI001B88277C|nr:uncharacterized protein EDB91DRAFT_124382 [Suillus paluster]KAG1724640.1 hypothetical protein EDB91DRAFT_124382 [Suillus paluster]